MSFNTFSSCSAFDSFLCLSFLFGRLLFVFCVFCVSSSELSLSVELSLSSELSSSDELDSSSSELSSFLFLFLCGGCGFFVGFAFGGAFFLGPPLPLDALCITTESGVLSFEWSESRSSPIVLPFFFDALNCIFFPLLVYWSRSSSISSSSPSSLAQSCAVDIDLDPA